MKGKECNKRRKLASKSCYNAKVGIGKVFGPNVHSSDDRMNVFLDPDSLLFLSSLVLSSSSFEKSSSICSLLDCNQKGFLREFKNKNVSQRIVTFLPQRMKNICRIHFPLSKMLVHQVNGFRSCGTIPLDYFRRIRKYLRNQ